MKLKKLLITLVLFMGVTGCGNNTEPVETPKDEPKGNCTVTECIKSLEATDSIEKINEVIGFEGEKSEFSENYTWKLDKKNSISLSYSGDSPILQATIDKETLKNEDVDLSGYNDIKALLDKGKSLTYKEMVEKVGGVEGTIAGKTTNSVRYLWVDKMGRNFSATFNNKNGKCTIISIK